MARQRSKRLNKFQSRETSEDPPLFATLLTEILFDIFIRLPVESLLRCKSVCKSWYSVISDPRFIKSHLSFSASNNHYAHHGLIFTTRRGKSLHTCSLYDVLHDKYVNAINHGYPLDKPNFYKPRLTIAGSCNGLLCVIMGNYAPFIWNPCTRRWNSLPYGFDHRDGRDACYGFGYDESTDDYKVVMISRANNQNEVKICSLKNRVWKKIGVVPRYYPFYVSGKFLNGALHWAACRPNYPWHIISLDIKNETYAEVLQPVYDKGHKDLTLGVLGECLGVLCNYEDSHADVWVMKVYGVKDSWTKMVSIPYLSDPGRDRFSMPLVISNDGKVLLRLGLKLTVYDSNNCSFSEIQNFVDCFEAHTYVESLVSPPIRWNLRKRRNP